MQEKLHRKYRSYRTAFYGSVCLAVFPVPLLMLLFAAGMGDFDFLLKMLLSTAFWSALAWFAHARMNKFRRDYRQATNQCTACGYNLQGSQPHAPCPECGHIQHQK